jgi:hypothetical protein
VPTLNPNIWQLQSKGDIDALIDALRHPEPNVRKGAAAALRALGAWQAVPALEAALAVENDWQSHAAITAAIQYLDHDLHVENMVKDKDFRGLIKMLTSNRHEDIITACNALGQIGDRRAVESLVTVFRNPLLPAPVRLAAAEALLTLESAPAVVTLLGALRRDNWQVRRNAAAVLGQLQATWAVQPLIQSLEDSNQVVRRTASAALRRIGTAEALAAANKYDESQAKLATITQEMPNPNPQGTGALPSTGSLAVRPDAPTLVKRPTGRLTPPTDTNSAPTASSSANASDAEVPSLSQITGTEAAVSHVSSEPAPTVPAATRLLDPLESVEAKPPIQVSADQPTAESAVGATHIEPVITPPPPDTLPENIPAPVMVFRPTDPKKPTGLLNQLRVKHDLPPIDGPDDPEEEYAGSHIETRIEPHITPPPDSIIEIIKPPSEVPAENPPDPSLTPAEQAAILRAKLSAEESDAKDDAETKPVVPIEDEPPPPSTKPL